MSLRTFINATLVYVMVFLAIHPVYAYNLPDMGDSTIHSISRSQEQDLGAQIMRNIRQSSLYNTDPIVAGYVQSLGVRITAANEHSDTPFDFFVINDPRVNAFALPGGYIGINAGLILVAENEDEVAGVMAHEIAHVTQRHIARMIERSQSLSWPLLAALLGSMILASASPAAGGSAMAATLAGANQDMINFTRSNEEEADRIGMDMLAKADFDPNGMSSFFARMAEANKYNDSFYVPDFLRTHPVNSDRIADAMSRAKSYKVTKRGDDLSFRLIIIRPKWSKVRVIKIRLGVMVIAWLWRVKINMHWLSKN
jgi:predicted Zn-dependent protease